MNQGPADLQSAALTTELCTHVTCIRVFVIVQCCLITFFSCESGALGAARLPGSSGCAAGRVRRAAGCPVRRSVRAPARGARAHAVGSALARPCLRSVRMEQRAGHSRRARSAHATAIRAPQGSVQEARQAPACELLRLSNDCATSPAPGAPPMSAEDGAEERQARRNTRQRRPWRSMEAAHLAAPRKTEQH